MGDIHVAKATGTGKLRTIVMHFTVPDTNNSAGVNHRTCLRNSKINLGSVLSKGDGTGGTISNAEQALLSSGELFEHVFDLDIETGIPNDMARTALLQSQFSLLKTTVIPLLEEKLRFFGLEHDQPPPPP